MTLSRRRLLGISTESTLNNGVVSYWKFDDLSGPAIDSAGSNNGTVVGATQGAAGKIGTAYSFDGNDYINIDNAVNDVATDTEGTFATWVRPVVASSAGRIFGFGDTNANEFITFTNNGNAQAVIALTVAGVTKFNIRTTTTAFTNNTWAHVAVVQDGISPIIYINAIAVPLTDVISVDKTLWFVDVSGVDTGRLGSLNYNSGGESLPYVGNIDEPGIWNRPLTQPEMTELYNGGSGLTYPF
ncbi:hypothetical protein LCGC14_0245310 [marine sediment metagenome]|uniref:LamG-like jellyroll fold domain-containing protein n=1 Tax=marine sediment metagenome TaxID=412755 RepID=A0A0F9U610_9ZZZZ